MKKLVVFILFLLFSNVLLSQTAMGDIESYMGNLIDNAPGNSGNNYNEPNTTELTTWNSIISDILNENIATARTNANTLNYQITEFTDTSLSPNQIFYVLEEKSSQSNYWGIYAFSKTPTRNNLVIQAPHSKYDTNTGKQAVYCFKNTIARAVFINGTHRCNSNNFSSCSGTTGVCGSSGESYRISDQAHVTNSMFQKTTENLLSTVSNPVFVQLHGFGKSSTDPYVIMSNGTRETPSTDYATLIKDALLVEDNSLTFKLAHIDTGWTRLIGFTNTQGRLINNSTDFCNTSATASSGRFIHIEQEKLKLRNDEEGWAKMSNALMNVFSSTLGTNNFNFDNSVAITPNPTLGQISISGLNINSIEVFNAIGQQLLKLNSFIKNDKIWIDLKAFSKGIYLLKINSDYGVSTKKVIYL